MILIVLILLHEWTCKLLEEHLAHNNGCVHVCETVNNRKASQSLPLAWGVTKGVILPWERRGKGAFPWALPISGPCWPAPLMSGVDVFSGLIL